MGEELLKVLADKNLTLAAAESLTGGLFASTLVAVPGMSNVFKGSIVSYWAESKQRVLHVSHSTIENNGVVSKECALEMAKNALTMFDSDIAIAFTGNAGPTALENKEDGLVYIALVTKNDADVRVLKCTFNGDRNEVREKCVKQGINEIIKLILQN